MNADARDRVLQAHVPAVMVPRFGALQLPEKPGHRYLVAEDGVWLEVLRPWLHARVNAGHSEIALPYGRVEQKVQFAFQADAIREMEHRFLHDAAHAFPNECAAWAVYDETTGRLDYRPLIAGEASPTRVKVHRPRLKDHEHLAIDLHSHAAGGAGFSAEDDEDDAGEVKYAIVIGNINSDLSYARRLCLLGLFIEGDA